MAFEAFKVPTCQLRLLLWPKVMNTCNASGAPLYYSTLRERGIQARDTHTHETDIRAISASNVSNVSGAELNHSTL